MAKTDEPTVKVKLEPDTADFEAKLAAYQERARKAMLLPADLLGARIEALRAAIAVHTSQQAAFTADTVRATAEKFDEFLLGNEHRKPHVHTPVDMHAEQSAQAYLAKHTGR